MNRKALIAVAVSLAMMAGAAWILSSAKRHLHLGQPGVKLVAESLRDEKGQPVGTNSVFLPPVVFGSASSNLNVSEVELKMLPADTTYGRRFYQWPDGFYTTAMVVLMGTDRSSIHTAQTCLTGQGWTIEESKEMKIPIVGAKPYELPVIRNTLLRRIGVGGEMRTIKSLFVFYFVSAEQITPRRGERMWNSAWQMLKSGEMPRWAYVIFTCPCLEGHEEAAYERLSKFIAETVPQFQTTTTP